MTGSPSLRQVTLRNTGGLPIAGLRENKTSQTQQDNSPPSLPENFIALVERNMFHVLHDTEYNKRGLALSRVPGDSASAEN